jgi:hypothetical protein
MVIAAMVAALAALTWFIAVAPAILGLTVAVAMATLWCVWLERQPG